METVKLSKEELVELIGLKKAKKTYPDMFKDEEAMHVITDKNITEIIQIANGDDAPGAKYDGKSLKLSSEYHWSIIKRTTASKQWGVFLIPIKREYSKKNPLNKLRTAANFGRLKKAAARKRRGRPRKTEKTND